MNTNDPTQRSEGSSDQEQRLQSAMKILIDYLLEHGNLTPDEHLVTIISDSNCNQVDIVETSPASNKDY